MTTYNKQGLGTAALLLIFALSPSARADIYGAVSAYEKQDFSAAFEQFTALAEIGQPVAQLDLAKMYELGQATSQSDIYAYAWASLAAQNGEAEGKKLADEIGPRLAPGSERIAGWITGSYTSEALSQGLLPDPQAQKSGQADKDEDEQAKQCKWVKVTPPAIPSAVAMNREEGEVFAEFTLMPDGTARLPRVVFEFPAGLFGPVVRDLILRGTFNKRPPDSGPIDCPGFLRFTNGTWYDHFGASLNGYSHLSQLAKRMHERAIAGDPNSEFVYGMLLTAAPQLGADQASGLAWVVKAAQAGLPQAQFEVGFSLLGALGCRKDEAKALQWLHFAAAQNEPNAEVILATRALHGTPDASKLEEAASWLEKAAAQGNQNGRLYLAALLAAAPQPGMRNPVRALEMVSTESKDIGDDPVLYEIRAAAEANQGDFKRASDTEQEAISKARSLNWDLSPLEQRLIGYQSSKPYYGDLLEF